MKRFIGPLVALVLGAAATGVWLASRMDPATRVEVRTGVVEVDADAELTAAILIARRQLPAFIKAFRERKGAEKFAINGKFKTPRGPEHLWVRIDRFEDEVFHGRLDVEPVALVGKQKGDPVSVPESDVVDWIYESPEGVRGGFTLKANR